MTANLPARRTGSAVAVRRPNLPAVPASLDDQPAKPRRSPDLVDVLIGCVVAAIAAAPIAGSVL